MFSFWKRNKGLFSESIFAYAKKTRFCVFKIIIGSDFEKEELYVTDKEIKFNT